MARNGLIAVRAVIPSATLPAATGCRSIPSAAHVANM